MAKTVLHTTPSGVTMLVQSDKRLDTHGRRLWISDISKQSIDRIVTALAMQTASFIQSAKQSPQLQELCDEVSQKNELAASELDQLGQYRWTLHCATN